MAASATAAVFSGLCFRRGSSDSSKRLSSKTQAVSDVGFVTSQLSGLKISHDMSSQLPSPIFTPSLPGLQPIVARRICPFTGKKANKANKISFSAHKTKKLQFVNLQYKRIWWEGGKRFLKLRLSTKAIKTIEKNGLEAVAKKAGIDLRKC
ncbi:PREDICTED: 50S ribosomal protein L28, chloroplastic-like [Fragaria vesca subsp. vesca]|uniref:50S ribosomal protein L28, chloroplastic n=1 Tax=Fragaria vesca subsp. vesca TaxID=101020 RepID=UPI0002C3545D|nr:PREDICTED: 50S ribosomal protein L28, chloroplastic [Fragaria vesca subsp. vesca]